MIPGRGDQRGLNLPLQKIRCHRKLTVYEDPPDSAGLKDTADTVKADLQRTDAYQKNIKPPRLFFIHEFQNISSFNPMIAIRPFHKGYTVLSD